MISDTDHKFKSESNSGSFGGDDTKGWYEIEWEISKGKVDQDYLDNLNKNLQYRVAGGAWQSYDPNNPPAYGSGTIEIRFNPAKYPDGVTNAEITVNDKNTNIGTYTAQVKLTVDTANYETVATQSFQWRIGAKQIEVDWTSESWTDASGDNVLDDYGVPYQIKTLNIADDLKQYVEYQYYIANSDLSMGTYVGTGNVGLEALTSAPYNASSVNPIYVYVKAVIKSGVTQYELKDDSGDDCALLFRLGATNTLVTVTQTVKEMTYGGSTFDSGILTLIASDTNAALGANFIEGIYVYDSQGNELGLLSGFDGTTAKAGVYTLKIVLTEAGNDTYTLTPGSKFTFTVKPKAIAVPTLSDIVFKNDFVDLRDYLGGSWTEYQSIIKLGGTYDGVKNVGTYSVTLTLTDENYCWDYGTSASPAKATVKYSLTDGNVAWTGDETVASYDWKITPYVLKASSWNLSGKEGAVYNIP
ncbi:MAG: hypothetical protein K2J83_03795, partial [Clostridia bacterium]|nr:hypothetical protein [Clostridia bacterium]